MNPASQPQPVEDVQGDERWMSQVWSFEILLRMLTTE